MTRGRAARTGTDHSAKAGSPRRRRASTPPTTRSPTWSIRAGSASPGTRSAPPAVSYVGQLDDRVDAIAAWDNLRAPSAGRTRPGPGGPPTCASGSSPRPTDLPITKPALGISNDYGIAPTPNTSDPDPAGGERRLPRPTRTAGVDSMEFHIRGGTHEESAFIPGNMTVPALGLATLRGGDLVAWYTTAWFDHYVKCQGDAACEADADKRLLTDRWRNDARGGAGRRQRRPQPLLVLSPLALRPHPAPTAAKRPATTCAPAARRWRPTACRPATTSSPMPTPRPTGSSGEGRTVRAAPARDDGQGHAEDARARAAPATRSAARAATTGCAAATVTTASTAAPATTGSRGDAGRDKVKGGAGDDRLDGRRRQGQARRRLRRRPHRRPRRRSRQGPLRPRPRQGPRRQARQARRRLLAPAAGSCKGAG